MSDRSVRVGLVDSGVNPDGNPALASALVAARAFHWNESAAAVEPGDDAGDELGHGSALASTLVAVAPGVKLLVARVFFGHWGTRPAQVAAALDWLRDAGAQVINLSLGLREDRAVLREACERTTAGGVILVASTPARGEPVYPAAYPGVIRATGDARCAPGEWSWLATPQADFAGCVNSADGRVSGASAGAAHVSAHIAMCLQDPAMSGRDELLGALRRGASYHGPERRGPV